MENYESLGVIGEGTYGVVMKARHKGTGQVVAIKKFKESDDDEQVRKTSLREVRVLKQLRHDNVIHLLEAFRRKGKLYLVFEYVEQTILEVLERKPNGLDEMDVKKYTYQLLRGVEYIHAHNIIHRDVKPENILIAKSGALKICDFGFARPMSVGGKYTDYVATRWYRGPELLVGDVEYGKGVDVWAIGCIFAEISNGMPLFAGESDLDQLHVIMRCNGKITNRQAQIFRRNALYVGVELPNPRDLETLDMRFPSCPKSWLGFLKACLKNDPDQRETCSGLLSLPYFTERNFKSEYDAELKMIMDKETRGNGLSRQRIEAHQAQQENKQQLQAQHQQQGQSQSQQQQQHHQQQNKMPPVSSTGPIDPLSGPNNNSYKSSQPTLPTGKLQGSTGGGSSGGGQQQGGTGQSLWSQYLHQASDPRSSGGSGGVELPGVTGKGSTAGGGSGSGGGGGSFLPPSHKPGSQGGFTSSGTGGSGYGGGGHSSYSTSYQTAEPMMVTNNHHHSSTKTQSSPYGLNAQSNLGGGGGLSKKPPTHGLGGGGALPTLGGGGGSLPPTSSMHSGGWTAPGSSGGMGLGLGGTAPGSGAGGGGTGGTASQLTYKKKPGKRNVLSTLSLTTFGGAQQGTPYNPLDSSAPPPTTGGSGLAGGTSGGIMMLQGQSHSLQDHHHNSNPGQSQGSRRTSKPWMNN